MKGAKQLRDMIYSILENSDTVSDVTLKNSPNSSTLLLNRADGKGRMTFHTLFPGLTLAFIFVNAPVWPESDENSNLKPLLINYCVFGRSELLLDDGSYIYLKENDFCVSEQTAQKEYIFPTKQYQGIKIYFDLSLLLQSCGELLKSFSLDLPTLEKSYCGNHKTYINEADSREEGIWETNIFGKSIEQLVQDGIRSKLTSIGEESQSKLQSTMQKIVNDSKGGMVCIII